MRRANVFRADCEFDDADPDGYRSGVARVGQAAQGEALVVKVFYPDSDKIGVWPGNAHDDVILHRADGRVGYWDGER
jgi:hypothetical protein